MIETHPTRSRTRRLALGAAGTLIASTAVAAPAIAAEPPQSDHQVISFPQRDFVSASGYTQGVDAYVQVIRKGVVVATSTAVQPQDDPSTAGFDGIVEVNHPGGGCWDTVTPDIRPGDKVRVFQDDPADKTLPQISDDTTTSAAVTAGKPVLELVNGVSVVTIHGTAQSLTAAGDPTGVPLPLGQVEQRLINRDKFSVNGRRDLRAPRDTTMSYDAAGSIRWTVRYPRLAGADVTKALNAESRALWLGRDPGAGTELTIYETGPNVAPGPSSPCTAPLEGTTTVVRTPVAPSAALLPAASSVAAPGGSHVLIAFPSRDFVSADGYTAGTRVSFSVFRGGRPVGQSDVVTVGADGLAEVNHPGGGCWLDGTQTPNIRPGDVVRITDLGTHVAEETTVADVTAAKPVKLSATTVQVSGTSAVPLAQVEQRLVNPQKFANGRRTLRSPGDGALTAGLAGSWTATYTNLSAADVTKAMVAESRALWLGPDGLGSQMTIFEAPDPAGGIVNGPQAPCVAPAEVG